ncbi:isoaspartyl peptidase/L-asparaginase family protein [Candidatus Oscillochloris fontis]|uniref:isoaspartyl peptidase/L-asparaginase family protein n=1 Tax=Candidatus Oscillochloris fontis TaxID=2496868 RepID=UPI00101E1BF8|nr:isoaspartyl peptidase/L-asparaginase [Candidatus Oscillochloris fontis]
MPIALVVHGGAWDIPDDQVEAHHAGCQAALKVGWQLLRQGASALDVCEASLRVMEDDPIFDAGIGSVLTTAGTVELDAAVMDGTTLRYGAVANLRRIRNPISLARKVLEGPATMLVGEGAEQFAIDHEIPLIENHELIVERERALWEAWKASGAVLHHGQPRNIQQIADPPYASEVGGHDTVGVIALDQHGNLVAANSTGGTLFKLPGRIGDTALIGAGLYADSQIGAAVCTGWGESITRVALARRAIDLLERGLAPQSAAESAIRSLARQPLGGSGGCILLAPNGQIGMAWNTRRMAYAYQVEG